MRIMREVCNTNKITHERNWNVINWAELSVKSVECVECIGNVFSTDATIAQSTDQLQLLHRVQRWRCHCAIYRRRHHLCQLTHTVLCTSCGK